METLFRPGFLRRWVVAVAPVLTSWFEPFPEAFVKPYAFDEPDSEDNLLVTAREGRLAGWNAGASLDVPQIRGATFLKLVERATYHAYFDQELADTFLLTYTSFTTSSELLMTLIKRYHVKRDAVTDPAEQERLTQIQLRVLNLLKMWVKQYWIDFAKNPELQRMLKTFVQSKVLEIDEQSAGQALAEAMIKAESEWLQRALPALSNMSLWRKATEAFPEPGNINALLLSLDIKELAQQLTLLQAELFYQISPDELITKVWKKASHGGSTESLDRMIESFNQTSNWVQVSILHARQLEDRVAVLKFYVKLAHALRELNNFNGLMVIQAAMESASVHRLHKTWEGLSKEKSRIWDEIASLMSNLKNFANYRAALHSCQPPCIPYLGLYLTDLTFICDGNDDMLKRKGATVPLINVEKRRMMARAVTEIRGYQQARYGFQPKADLQSLLLLAHGSAFAFTEAALYDMSLALEPRTPQK